MNVRLAAESVTCLGCGCACDDIAVFVDDGRIAEPRNACPLGVAWFGDGQAPGRSRIDGRDVPVEQAITAAAAALAESVRPLVYLAPDISCEVQREAIAIADLLGGRLDTVTSATAWPVVRSGQERGYASATLGEIRNRADVVVFWAVDADRRYPRFAPRYAPDPQGLYVPEGRRSRTVVAVDVGGATTVADADTRVAVSPQDEIAMLGALQAFTRPSNEQTVDLSSLRGNGWDAARVIAPLLLAAKYVALVYDAEPDERARRSPLWVDAITTLSLALNERTRCAAIALRAGGNRSGADATLTAQTGHPCAVDFAPGYPRYVPYDGSAAISLTRGDVDLVLVVGNALRVPDEVRQLLTGPRCVVIGPRASDSPLGGARVVVDTGVAGIHSAGTALRTDDVPLPLRPSVPGPPPAEDLVRLLTRALISARPSAGAAARARPAEVQQEVLP